MKRQKNNLQIKQTQKNQYNAYKLTPLQDIMEFMVNLYIFTI
jgi:hypothetical protein